VTGEPKRRGARWRRAGLWVLAVLWGVILLWGDARSMVILQARLILGCAPPEGRYVSPWLRPGG
jgi:hypothetical protein